MVVDSGVGSGSTLMLCCDANLKNHGISILKIVL